MTAERAAAMQCGGSSYAGSSAVWSAEAARPSAAADRTESQILHRRLCTRGQLRRADWPLRKPVDRALPMRRNYTCSARRTENSSLLAQHRHGTVARPRLPASAWASPRTPGPSPRSGKAATRYRRPRRRRACSGGTSAWRAMVVAHRLKSKPESDAITKRLVRV